MLQPRCVQFAEYMLKNKVTVRRAAAHFGVSKTTFHVEVTERLKKYDNAMYLNVQELLDKNWNEKAYRGGIGCQRKHPDLVRRNFHLSQLEG